MVFADHKIFILFWENSTLKYMTGTLSSVIFLEITSVSS